MGAIAANLAGIGARQANTEGTDYAHLLVQSA